jgi:predicted dehydrogenase
MNKIRIGIVGLNFGRHILTALTSGPAQRQFILAGVCDANPARARAAVEATGAPHYPSLAAMLADPRIEAVGLFTGPHGRAELLKACLAAGKHVMTTKPFEFSAAGATEVLALARERRMTLHLNSPGSVDSAEMACIAEWRRRYRLGSLVGLHGEAWCSYTERPDGSWYDDPQRCPLAPVLRIGVYLINDMIRLAGAPTLVQAQETRIRTRRLTSDNALLTLRFANQALGSIYASLCVDDGQPYRNGLTLNFERGTIRRNQGLPPADDAWRSELLLSRRDARGRPVGAHRRFAELSGDYQWTQFARSVRQWKPPTAEFEANLMSGVRVVAALHEAARTGMAVSLPESGKAKRRRS